MAARAGEVHLVHEVPARDVQTLEDAEGLEVVAAPGTFWEYIGLNTRRSPLDDPRVRQAIAWAVDRDQLNAAVKRGQATPLRAANLPPHHWAALTDAIYPQRDLEKARALLQEAGHDEGIELTLIVDASVGYQVRAAEMIKQQLAPAGIDVAVQAMETTAFFDKLGAGDFDATVVGWMGFVDPDQWMYDLFHSQGQYNQQGFADAQVDQLLEEGRRSLDRRAVTPTYQQAQRRVADLAPMVFLYVNPQTSAVREEVQGYVVHPTATTIFLRDASVAEDAEDAAADAAR
jgi:peptide/nickel transport system substrate-binding protein